MNNSLPLFVASVIGISLTGVMMPGPVTAVTVAKGYRAKGAGGLIALGHILIEIPLIVLIYFGLARYLSTPGVKIAISLAGGLMLIWMAFYMFKAAGRAYYKDNDLPYNSVVAGLVTTVTNPYFFLWWATVGAALLTTARAFGIGGVVVLAATHWLCDFGWLIVVSFAVFKSRRLWTEKVHHVIYGLCALILAGFCILFVVSGAELAISV
jgi:threonine/homoserine/homoserine lactone efflux protein